MPAQPAAATACAALRILAFGSQRGPERSLPLSPLPVSSQHKPWHFAARASLERNGLIQPLVEAMAARPAHPALLAAAAELIAGLTVCSRDPHGVSSHFGFEAARRVAAAMAEHPTHLQLQGACCGATAALAGRSEALGHALATDGAAAACVAAMRRFRSSSRSAATLQTNACAALAALAGHPQAHAELERLGGMGLFLSTIAEHGSDSDSDAAVVVGGWRAILGMLGQPQGAGNGIAAAPDEHRSTGASGTTERLPSNRLPPRLMQEQIIPLLWRCCRVHSRCPAVLCACAAVLAELLWEDARRVGGDQLGCCADAQGMHYLLHSIGLFFCGTGQNAPGVGGAAGMRMAGSRPAPPVGSGAPPSLVRHVSRACEAMVNIGGPRRWFTHHELLALQGQMRALRGGDAGETGEAEELVSALRRIDDELAAAAPASRAKARV
jgi:hypothetical protein